MNYIQVDDLVRISFPIRARPGMIMMLEGYFDDSGTHNGSPVVVWGGLLGVVEQWRELEKNWLARLAEPLPGKPPLERFHLSACEAGDDEFRDYSRAERDRLTYLFRSIIADSGLFNINAVVVRQDWEDLIQGRLRDRLGNAEAVCFMECIAKSLEHGHVLFPRETQIAITFDFGRQKFLQALADRIMAFDREPIRIVHLGFSPMAEFAPLQAADMIATESYWAAQKWLDHGTNEKARAHFRHLLQTISGEGVILDREAIEQTVENYARNGVFP